MTLSKNFEKKKMIHPASFSLPTPALPSQPVPPQSVPVVRFGTYTQESLYNVVIQEVEAGLKGYVNIRRRYEEEKAYIEKRRAEYEELRNNGERFHVAHGWDRIDVHYDRYRDVLLHLERIGLYTQAEWFQNKKAKALIQSAIKLIPDLEPYTAKALRKFAMKESVGVLPPAISDAVEAFYNANQDESKIGRAHV